MEDSNCKRSASKGFRGHVIVFRLNAAAAPRSCLQPAFLRNEAECSYTSGEAHTRRSQVQILPRY
jgi:hypothetical protein